MPTDIGERELEVARDLIYDRRRAGYGLLALLTFAMSTSAVEGTAKGKAKGTGAAASCTRSRRVSR